MSLNNENIHKMYIKHLSRGKTQSGISEPQCHETFASVLKIETDSRRMTYSEEATNVKAVKKKWRTVFGQNFPKHPASVYTQLELKTLKRTLQHTCCLSSLRKPQRNDMTRSCHRECREKRTLPERILVKVAFSRVKLFCKEKMF